MLYYMEEGFQSLRMTYVERGVPFLLLLVGPYSHILDQPHTYTIFYLFSHSDEFFERK